MSYGDFWNIKYRKNVEIVNRTGPSTLSLPEKNYIERAKEKFFTKLDIRHNYIVIQNRLEYRGKHHTRIAASPATGEHRDDRRHVVGRAHLARHVNQIARRLAVEGDGAARELEDLLVRGEVEEPVTPETQKWT